MDVVGVVHRAVPPPEHRPRAVDSVGSVRPTAHTMLTTWGGHTPIAFVGELGYRVARLVSSTSRVMVGGEANATRDAMRRAGPRRAHHPAPTADADHDEPETWGAPLVMADPVDRDRGGDLPINTYAVFDSALRAEAGETLDASRDRSRRRALGRVRPPWRPPIPDLAGSRRR